MHLIINKPDLWFSHLFQKVNYLPLALCLIVTSLQQQLSVVSGQPADLRPKVGLALSGGGSGGLAHIGVLKVMEEAGLRPDYITGVSMGCVIGGLYALGYPADSLEKIVKEVDWNYLLSNRLPESKIIYPGKKRFYNSVVTIPVMPGMPILPPGLNNGQQMENMLGFYAWPAAGIDDFLKLPVPFMCLATNLETCRKVDLTGGYLPDVMRASSAVPTIFTPLKIDSIPFIDGGMVRNFAVSEVKEMGAEIVIGSYTGSYLSKKGELQSITDILSQLLFFVGVYDFQDQKKLVDILIEPKTDDIPPTSFADIDTIIRRGYKAALPLKESFKKLADSLDQLGFQKPLKDILGNQFFSFDKIEIVGNKRISKSQITGILNIKTNEETDRTKLKDNIDLLYGKSWFEKVKYRIIPRNDSLVLVIECVESPRITLYGSVHYDNALRSGLILGLTLRNPLGKSTLLEINTRISHYYAASIEYFQYFNRSQKISISAQFFAENTFIPRFQLLGSTGGTFNRIMNQGIAINKRFGLNHQLSLMLKLENRALVPDYISEAGLNSMNNRFNTESLVYNINSLNTKHFPGKGIDAQLLVESSRIMSGNILPGTNTRILSKTSANDLFYKRFYTIKGTWNQYFTAGRKLVYGISGTLLFTTNSDSVSARYNFYFLGGNESTGSRTIPMAGFHPFQIPVRSLAGLGLNIGYEIFEKVHLTFTSNFFIKEEMETAGKNSFLAGFGIGAGYMSIIGPLRAGLMYGIYDHERYFSRLKGYISLGYGF